MNAALPPTAVRVERHSSDAANAAIRQATDATVARHEHADADALGRRLAVLDREWDVERLLQANAGTLAFTGTLVGALLDRRALVLPAAVFSFFLQHALHGWCPPLPILRRLHARTVREIERERHALKALRGDFEALAQCRDAPPSVRVRRVLDAIDR